MSAIESKSFPTNQRKNSHETVNGILILFECEIEITAFPIENWSWTAETATTKQTKSVAQRTRIGRFLFTNELQLQIITVWPPLSSSPSTGGSLSNRIRRFTEKKSSHDQQPSNSSSCSKQQMLHRSRYRSGLLCIACRAPTSAQSSYAFVLSYLCDKLLRGFGCSSKLCYAEYALCAQTEIWVIVVRGAPFATNVNRIVRHASNWN